MDLGPWETAGSPTRGGDIYAARQHIKELSGIASEAAEAVQRVYQPPQRPQYDARVVTELDEAWSALTSNMFADLDATSLTEVRKPKSKKIRVPRVVTNPIVSRFRDPVAGKEPAPAVGAKAGPPMVTMLHGFDRHSELSFGGAMPRRAAPPTPEAHARPRAAQAALDARVAQAMRRPGCPPSYQRAVERARASAAGTDAPPPPVPSVVRPQTARPRAEVPHARHDLPVAMRISSLSHARPAAAQLAEQV
eukprot:3317162-Prymnesium_polylepis.2